MEFAIKVIVVVLLAIITLMVLILVLSQSAGAGTSMLDQLFNYFGGIFGSSGSAGTGTLPDINPTGDGSPFPR